VFHKAEFRMLVDVPTPLRHLVMKCFDLCLDLHEFLVV
jgi:hypothetical protein